jgi:hypothetical protein
VVLFSPEETLEKIIKISVVLIENLGQETDGLLDICAEILLFATK